MNKRKKVLIFDVDGTIVDSLNVAFRAYNSICEKYGLKKFKSEKEFTKLYLNNIYDSLVEMGLEKGKIQEFNHDLRNSFVKLGYGPKLFKGMKEVFNQLVLKNEVIVITSNITSTILHLMDKAGLKKVEVIGSDKEPSKVKKINSIKERFFGREIFYIGDTIGDILEARKAGVKSIGVTWGYHSWRELKKVKPDFIVRKPEELLNLFK